MTLGNGVEIGNEVMLLRSVNPLMYTLPSIDAMRLLSGYTIVW